MQLSNWIELSDQELELVLGGASVDVVPVSVTVTISDNAATPCWVTGGGHGSGGHGSGGTGTGSGGW